MPVSYITEQLDVFKISGAWICIKIQLSGEC